MCNGCKCAKESVYTICKEDVLHVLGCMGYGHIKDGSAEYSSIEDFLKNNIEVDWHYYIKLALEDYIESKQAGQTK